MIKEINSDLLDCEANVLVHQTNCQCTQGSGIARQMREKYPEEYDADCKTKKGDINKLGTYSFAKTHDGKIVFNCYSQFYYGREKRHTNYEAIYCGLEAIRDKVLELQKDGNKYVVGIPYKMGCCLGGGDWRIVRAIIEVIFGNCEIECLIVRKDFET